jgi:hypothetical protein
MKAGKQVGTKKGRNLCRESEDNIYIFPVIFLLSNKLFHYSENQN